MPIQRIPRYLLLLAELKKYTPAEHPDHAHLSKAETLIGATAKHINEQVRARYGPFLRLETENTATFHNMIVFACCLSHSSLP
jgi:hypothetical protein